VACDQPDYELLQNQIKGLGLKLKLSFSKVSFDFEEHEVLTISKNAKTLQAFEVDKETGLSKMLDDTSLLFSFENPLKTFAKHQKFHSKSKNLDSIQPVCTQKLS